MTKLDERGAHAADELRREIASVPVPEPGRLVRRARHTRIVTAAAAALVLAVGSLAVARAVDSRSSTHISTGNQPRGPRHDARPAPTTPPTPLGAPLVQGPDAASTLLTSWGLIHAGYVFVYGDGRVLAYPDQGVWVNADGRVTVKAGGPTSASKRGAVLQYAVIERRLSPRGLDLVRAGTLDPSYFLGLRGRKTLWAEPTPRVWQPTTYALCYSGNLSTPARDVVGALPAPVQALLAGKERTYDPSIGTAHWEFPFVAPGTLTDCFEVTAAESLSLYQILDTNGLIHHDGPPSTQGWGAFGLSAYPVFPHGQYVIFGG